MKSPALQPDKLSPAEIILEAAVKRFGEYGYNKTTMAEIADDAGMSAANIYRYFKNKEEIAAECAKNWMCQRTDVLKSVVRDNQLSAAEKLETYILKTLEIAQEKAAEGGKDDELCAEITKNRPDLVHDKIKNEEAILVEILSYGNQTGEFDIDNVQEMAQTIHSMLVVFDVPMFMHLFSKEEFAKRAASETRFIIAGLGKTK